MAQLLDSNEIFFTPFEPKVANRFIMFIEGIPAYLVRKASRPTVTFEEIILDHINVQRKIKGKATWSDVTVELYDPVVPSAAQAVMEWVRLHHESVTGRAGYSDFYKKDLTLQILGPVGDIVSEWVIKGAFITNMDQGGFDWATDETVELSMTVAMDYCVLNF